MSTIRFYESTSGDKWDLIRDEAANEAFVRHTPNLASGGQVSQTPLTEFLRLQPHSAEHQAILAILGPDQAAAESVQSVDERASIKGYVHDPKAAGGPYIAVVLYPGKDPLVTLHKSYAEAERELEVRSASPTQLAIAHLQREDKR